MIVLVFGIQGSGKSTHAHFIANKLNIPYVSTGDLLREIEKEPTETGKKVRSLMEKGMIIPDEITVPALENYLRENNFDDNFLIEGFPRTMKQVEMLNRKVDLVFEIVVPEEIAIKRLKERGRYDDIEDSIKTRLELFKEKTLPVIEHYKKSGTKVQIVNNDKSIVEVQKEIDELLKDKTRN